MNRSEQINELAAALAKAQGEIKGAVKDATNPHFRSSYADLQSVWDAIREPLSKNGLSIMQFPLATYADDGTAYIHVETALAHTSGQWVSSSLTMTPERSTPQAFGSAITYARRYALQSIAGVAPMDDDGEAAEGRGGQPERTERAMERTDNRREASARQNTKQEPVELTGKWQDVVCHIGKKGGPILGKKLGELPKGTLDWLKEQMDSKGEKATAADRGVQAALAIREGEANPHDRIVETPPVAGNAGDLMKPVLEVLEFNEIPGEIFTKVATDRKWFADITTPTEAEVTRWMDNMDAAIGHCKTAMEAEVAQ